MELGRLASIFHPLWLFSIFFRLLRPVPDLKNFGRLPPLAADADVQFLQTQEQAANTATEVGNLVTIPNAGEQLRNGVPRFGNPKDFSSVMDGGDKAMQYGIGVAIQAAYGMTDLCLFQFQWSCWLSHLLVLLLVPDTLTDRYCSLHHHLAIVFLLLHLPLLQVLWL